MTAAEHIHASFREKLIRYVVQVLWMQGQDEHRDRRRSPEAVSVGVFETPTDLLAQNVYAFVTARATEGPASKRIMSIRYDPDGEEVFHFRREQGTGDEDSEGNNKDFTFHDGDRVEAVSFLWQHETLQISYRPILSQERLGLFMTLTR